MSKSPIGIPQKRGQHYLPQFFLKGFTYDGKHLNCLRRTETGMLQLLPKQSIENVCKQRDLYETALGNECGNYLFPNEIEDALASMENGARMAFVGVVEEIKALNDESNISTAQLDEIAWKTSILLSWLTYRNPNILEGVLDDIDIALSAFREHGLGTEEELKKLFVDSTGFEGDIPSGTFAPEAVVDHFLKYSEVIPLVGFSEEMISKTDMYQLAAYLRNCSIVVLTSKTKSFIGLDFPSNFKLDNGIATHYWPLSGEIAIAFLDDGRHEFGKTVLSTQKIEKLNLFAMINGSWDVAFCADISVIETVREKMVSFNELC